MSAPNTTFDTAKWMRVRVDFSFVTRPCRIEDLEGYRIMIDGDTIELSGQEFKNAMTLPNVWKSQNPKWQRALDAFIMQRVNYVVVVRKTCSADSIDLTTLYSKLLIKDTLEYFYGESASTIITYTWTDRNADSVYVIDSPSIEDHGNGTCTVTAKFVAHGDWEVMKRDPAANVIQ